MQALSPCFDLSVISVEVVLGLVRLHAETGLGLIKLA